MSQTQKTLEALKIALGNHEKRTVISFTEYLDIVAVEPQLAIRNIFQLFHDMVKSHAGKGQEEYPDDPERIGFVKYDLSKIFNRGNDNPFFADRLFANRFIQQVAVLRQGSQQNRLHVFEGPHGCGKSTFLHNLMCAFEEYTRTKAGQCYEIFWDIDLESVKVKIPCPSHDHPLAIIPKGYRVELIDNLLSDKKLTEFKHLLTTEKEYEWVFTNEACTICKSLFEELMNKVQSPEKVLEMLKVRNYKFDRRLGEGISIFNPGDKPTNGNSLSDKHIQEKLDQIFGDNQIKYSYSLHAKTNNGIYVLMDVKDNNKDRLFELHNIISEGIHKVEGTVEERVNSLFLALMNKEDKEDINAKGLTSLQSRITYNLMPYVLDVPTEIEIYRETFGEHINDLFLPGVLENFAKVIISSRMHEDCPALKEWVPDLKKYERYCDKDGLLLRMAIFGGVIPPWLTDEDHKKLTASVRRKLITGGEKEGDNGITGRESIRLFSEFCRIYGEKAGLISMRDIASYFKHKIPKDFRDKNIPKNFIDSLVNGYNYRVLNEVKESLYFFNLNQVSEQILHYLHATNYDIGVENKCEWTGKEVAVTIDLFKTVGECLSGREIDIKTALNLAKDIQERYVRTIAQEPDKKITETDLYLELLETYGRNLKERVLSSFLQTSNFKESIKCVGTSDFNTFDTRLKEYTSHMIDGLINKFGYTEQEAKEICIYVIDQNLDKRFS